MEEQKDMQNQTQDAPEVNQQTQAQQQPVEPQASSEQTGAGQTNQQGTQNSGNGSSAENAKLWGVLGYIISILFFIPLVSDGLKNNQYSKFHANQQLVLMIAWLVINIVGGIIPILGWFIIIPIGNLILFIIMIIGAINASKGEMKPLPMIGGINILK